MPAADAYVPGHGNRRFGVRAYDLDLDYTIAGNHLADRAAQGRSTVVLDDQGRVVKHLPDGTQIVL